MNIWSRIGSDGHEAKLALSRNKPDHQRGWKLFKPTRRQRFKKGDWHFWINGDLVSGKESAFFAEQGGLTEKWGQAWQRYAPAAPSTKADETGKP